MSLTKVHKIGIGLGIVSLITVGILGIRARKRSQRYDRLLKLISQRSSIMADGLEATKAFDISYIDNVLRHTSKTVITLKTESANQYAYQIKDALTPWYLNDDEEQIYAVFRALKDKVQVSQIVKAYQDQYQRNLIDVFKDRLNKSEIKIIMEIVAKLPPYRTL